MEFCAPRDVRYCLEGIVLRTWEIPSLIVAERAEPDGPFGEPAVEILRQLMPHLRQVALLQRELSALQARLAACTFFLDRSPFPFLLTDTRRRVLYSNAAANQISGLKDGIAVKSGQLSVRSLADQAALAKAIEKVDTRGVSLRRIQVQRPSHKPPYRLVLIPVPSSAAMPLGLSQPVAAVLIIDTQAGPELDPEILRVLFSLTPAEATCDGETRWWTEGGRDRRGDGCLYRNRSYPHPPYLVQDCNRSPGRVDRAGTTHSFIRPSLRNREYTQFWGRKLACESIYSGT